MNIIFILLKYINIVDLNLLCYLLDNLNTLILL